MEEQIIALLKGKTIAEARDIMIKTLDIIENKSFVVYDSPTANKDEEVLHKPEEYWNLFDILRFFRHTNKGISDIELLKLVINLYESAATK